MDSLKKCKSLTDYRTFREDFYKVVEFYDWLIEEGYVFS